MNIVGWYHSHTTFEPDPSLRDIENQLNYQKHFSEDSSHSSPIPPFVGAICSKHKIDSKKKKKKNLAAFDTRLPTPHSVVNWFCVEESNTMKSIDNSNRIPFAVPAKVSWEGKFEEGNLLPDMVKKIFFYFFLHISIFFIYFFII